MRPGRRLREIALILPLGGVALFMPPLVRIFDQPDLFGNVPLLHIYIFTLWLIGILLTGLVARRIARAAETDGVETAAVPLAEADPGSGHDGD